MNTRELAAECEDARRYFAATIPEWAAMTLDGQERALDSHMDLLRETVNGTGGGRPRGFLTDEQAR